MSGSSVTLLFRGLRGGRGNGPFTLRNHDRGTFVKFESSCGYDFFTCLKAIFDGYKVAFSRSEAHEFLVANEVRLAVLADLFFHYENRVPISSENDCGAGDNGVFFFYRCYRGYSREHSRSESAILVGHRRLQRDISSEGIDLRIDRIESAFKNTAWEGIRFSLHFHADAQVREALLRERKIHINGIQ